MRLKRFLILGAIVITSALVAGIALASHVPQVDPDDVPEGFLATHGNVQNRGKASLGVMADKRRIQTFVQHFQVDPNEALPWHSHPGPVVVTVVEGALIYENSMGGECRQRTYPAGTGFVDPGFGHVHRAIGGPEGADFYATYLLPRAAQTHVNLAANPPWPC